MAFAVYCSPIHIPEVEVQPPSNYRLFEEQSGLVIAVEPVYDRKKVVEYFGFDMLEQHVLPVLIIAENQAIETAYIINKDSCYLRPLAESPVEPEPERLKENIEETQATAELLFPPGLLPTGTGVLAIDACYVVTGIILIHELWSTKLKAETYKHNIIKKELMESSMYPGDSQHGFFYFKLPENPGTGLFELRLAVSDISHKERISYNFNIEIKGEDE